MHRSCVYEALGLLELSKRDLIMIKELDDRFDLKYLEESKKLENEGKYKESYRIKEFLQKLQSIQNEQYF